MFFCANQNGAQLCPVLSVVTEYSLFSQHPPSPTQLIFVSRIESLTLVPKLLRDEAQMRQEGEEPPSPGPFMSADS
jgi:hypothetical protein